MSRERDFYLYGRSTYYASRIDQRFPYCLYVPEEAVRLALNEGTTLPLAVIIHGTDRSVELYREAFVSFADQTGCALLLPLFSAGIGRAGELHGYKYLVADGIRYDEIVLSMVDEVAELVPIDSSRFLLTGFSGGGHFTHRFLYAHPERILAAAVGAPGVVTLLDDSMPWPAGIADAANVLGREVDPRQVALVPIQLAVGGADTETWEIDVEPDEPFYIPGVNDVGVDRQTRMIALRDSLLRAGATVQHDVVPGVAHVADLVFPVVRDFFARVLARRQSEQPGPAPEGSTV